MGGGIGKDSVTELPDVPQAVPSTTKREQEREQERE